MPLSQDQINPIVEKIAQRLTQWDVEVAKSQSRTLSRLLRNDTRDWWEQALTTHREELLGKLREILETTTETQDGCLEVAYQNTEEGHLEGQAPVRLPTTLRSVAGRPPSTG